MIGTAAFSVKSISLITLYSHLLNLYAPLLVFSSIHSTHATSTFSSQIIDITPVGNTLAATENDEVIFEEIKTLLPMSKAQIRVNQTIIPPGSKFLVIQVHAHNFNLTLSYNVTLIPHFHVNGTNIGLVVPLVKGQGTDLYITNFNISRNVSALIAALAYGKNAPIPGGCNMVFSVETSPYLEISYNREVVRVDVQAASPPDNSMETCEFSDVDIEMYHSFLPERDYSSETFFSIIQNMLTVDRIQKYATKVRETIEGPRMRRIFSAYPGTGSVYGVIATYGGVDGVYASAYVPAVTYACSTVSWADTCEVLTTTFAKVLCAIIFFVGLFVCLLGQRFFQPQVFIHSFFASGLISFMLLSPYLHTGLYVASIAFALAFALISIFFWRAFGWPLFHILIIYLNLGFLLASVVFYVGLGDIYIMESDINFWTSFAVLLLLVPMMLACVSNKVCIIAGGILGAFAVIVPIDHYIGSNLKFILLNTVRRATVPEFRLAEINPPFDSRDLALTITWILLSIIGISLQSLLQLNRPPYPPPPREFCCFHWQWHAVWPSNQHYGERTPLLVDARIPSHTPPDGYDDVFEPYRTSTASAPSSQLFFTH